MNGIFFYYTVLFFSKLHDFDRLWRMLNKIYQKMEDLN